MRVEESIHIAEAILLFLAFPDAAPFAARVKKSVILGVR